MGKIQIRRGVFETNSSSVHALVIPTEDNKKTVKEWYETATKEVKRYCEENTIVFDDENLWCPPKGYPTSVSEFLNRVSQLWATLWYDGTQKKSFYEGMTSLKDVLAELGLQYEIKTEDEDIWSIDINVEKIFASKESVAAFLFCPLSSAFSDDRDDYFSDDDGRYREMRMKLEKDGFRIDELGSDF